MNDRTYYPCAAHIDGHLSYFLWYGDEIDGIVMDGERIVTFQSAAAMQQYCLQRDLPYQDQSVAEYDFDELDAWVINPNSAPFDIKKLLNAWNMMDDFYKSIGESGAIADDDLDLHARLSHANFAVELPELLTSGKNYDPKWTDSDRLRLAAILHDSTGQFKAALRGRDADLAD